jgi:hypothetical protein
MAEGLQYLTANSGLYCSAAGLLARAWDLFLRLLSTDYSTWHCYTTLLITGTPLFPTPPPGNCPRLPALKLNFYLTASAVFQFSRYNLGWTLQKTPLLAATLLKYNVAVVAGCTENTASWSCFTSLLSLS